MEKLNLSYDWFRENDRIFTTHSALISSFFGKPYEYNLT